MTTSKTEDGATFTTGPWLAGDAPNSGDGFNVTDAAGRRIAYTSAVRNIAGKAIANHIEAEEARANANLIAAAPEMFETLKIAADLIIELGRPEIDDRHHAHIERINAALRKAQGGAMLSARKGGSNDGI